jgi:hypothetical protein
MAAGSLADEGCPKELAALVERGLLDDLVRPQLQRLRDGEPKRLRESRLAKCFVLENCGVCDLDW